MFLVKHYNIRISERMLFFMSKYISYTTNQKLNVARKKLTGTTSVFPQLVF